MQSVVQSFVVVVFAVVVVLVVVVIVVVVIVVVLLLRPWWTLRIQVGQCQNCWVLPLVLVFSSLVCIRLSGSVYIN